MTPVVVVGQGYVGLPLAMRAVQTGKTVIGFDTDDGRVRRLCAGHSYVEDVPSLELIAALDTGRYTPTTDERLCRGFGVGVITVPTPLKEGVPDLSFIEAAGRMLSVYVTAGATVVLESTTYPGTTVELLVPLLEEGSGLTAGSDFYVGYSPERLDPGNRSWNLVNTPKVVSGIDVASLVRVRSFYDDLVDVTVPVSRTQEAELVKLIENTFRHINVALVNEIAMFAADLGIGIWESLRVAETKPFGFMRFDPGPGVGGHCLPVDPSYLSWRVRRRVGDTFRFVELANEINDHMPNYVVRRITLALNRVRKPVNGSRILALGLSYKRNVGDARESPAALVVDLLQSLGADVRVADPHVDPRQVDPRVMMVDASVQEIDAADAVVVLTDHDAFDWDLIQSKARLIFDTRHRLSGDHIEHL